MVAWRDRYWNSAEGLRLHFRDYDGPADRPPLLCIPGLTRNASDFEAVADRYAGEWRVIAVDLRGRGDSEADPDSSRYSPPYYVADLLKLLDQLGIAEAVFVGTSLGGIVTMMLAATDEERIAGVCLNDVGPELDPAGIARIGSYVGKDTRFADWQEAARTLRDRNGAAFPDMDLPAWERFARRVAREEGGQIRFAYDLSIADNFRVAAEGAPVDAWPLYLALSGRPVTILHGELSDLLSLETAQRMAREIDGADLVTVPRVGHTPSFEEPESQAAMDRLLARVLER